MKNVCLVFIVFAALAGCSRDYRAVKTNNCEVAALADIKVDKNYELKSPPSDFKPLKTNVYSPVTHQKKIIKDGKIGLQADSVEAVKLLFSQEVETLEGYVAVEKLSNETGRKTLEMTVRVPARNFENLLSGIEKGKCKVLYKNINARDVTEEYMDVESRLRTKQKFADRYQELLKKANAVKDILEIEENLRTLQEEIESSEGRLKYLNDQVDFSTLEIFVNQSKETVAATPSFVHKMAESVKIGWQILVSIFLFIIKIWPIILLYAISWLVIKQFWNKYKNRKILKKSN